MAFDTRANSAWYCCIVASASVRQSDLGMVQCTSAPGAAVASELTTAVA
jgi:hypothetical protein